ncbi:hypothetical protein JTE90_022334 [Oedothorax gibbosus]|uniref:IRS-type PTB domain-containing protein n=1 Tax=Oedothorax gibbosus TaxID=931172 RepID=A0AAV6VYD1_9ARAC|nr:hypothetical protein JTE90_022334 [Oedothorax gibbosus]
MGCAYSRIFEENSRTFYVWNVDSEGRPVKPGRIEVTDSQLILHQKENVVVRWPLTSLRRYGFDSQVFSFECGRRCTTGAGVYAFKCRRAQALFSILQESINNSGGGTNDASATATSEPNAEHMNSLSRPLLPGERMNSIHSSTSLPNGNAVLNVGPSSPTVDSSGYLEPITANSNLHYPGNSSQRKNGVASPGGYICIHGGPPVHENDWMGSTSLPRCCSLGSCGRSKSSTHHHYVNNEVAEQQHRCINGMCIVNQYVNSSIIAGCSSPEHNENTYVNSMVALSPGHLPCCSQCVDFNTNYAKLDDLLKQEQQSAKKHKEQSQQPFYVNVKPERQHSGSSGSSKCVSGRSSPTAATNDQTLSRVTPGSPQHCYANLGGSPTSEAKEQAQVNYAVLDLDQNEAVLNTASVPVPVSPHHSLISSPVKSPEGYAQIDFDKTVALSNSANPCPAFNDDSMRKTRHNAVIPCSSMTT